MPEPSNYLEKVYAAVLGKVIGVYVGKPIEGWSSERIERELGEIWFYPHERLNYPLVASDDDISGTFTFIRALPDHGAWRDATAEQFGQTWLNYLIEHQTVLWWGGMGVSTEHTAWLRLAGGVAAPRSGSIELNGPTVAEQIGAQIFIDGCGLVAPGEPELAARLARQAARVSHDGEAVHAAAALAAMEAAAFVEPDMTRLLNVALSVMPDDCLIARLHRDVRDWAAAAGDDWRKTLAKIQANYGYDKFGGGCHMVPNHAVMVMAWAHEPDDFQRSLMITNTAGWDTDCNSGNVGCLMGVKGGLAGIAAGPDWQGPFADRILIPTAEGTRGISDCLREADLLAAIGRKVMGWPDAPALKGGARFHFSLAGSRHGFLPVRDVGGADDVYVHNPAGRLCVDFDHLAPHKPARAVTPTFLTPDQLDRGRSGYRLAVAPTLYSGQTVTASVASAAGTTAPVRVRLFARHYVRGGPATGGLGGDGGHKGVLAGQAQSDPVDLAPGALGELTWTLPDTAGWPIALLGISVECGPSPSASGQLADAPPSRAVRGSVQLDRLSWSGAPTVRFADAFPQDGGQSGVLGWIIDGRLTWRNAWGGGATLNRNAGLGLMHTGTAEWADYTVSGRMEVRLADRAGLAARFGGLRRYLALLWDRGAAQLQLVRQFDGLRQVVASAGCDWRLNQAHELCLTVRGRRAVAAVDGKDLFDAEFDALPAGGIACLVESGTAGFADLAVRPA